MAGGAAPDRRVAAALVRLAVDLGGPHPLHDPFCGSGTLVGEASRCGLPVYAADRSDTRPASPANA
ncbi:hypothetical protein [Micromonospora sp. CPCC 206171]|uniref:hypothetical protein n=1 Tax=Micromonospora sp. CPCC 206171 TaxID=3122405 RepID=UPI003FA5C1CB